MQVHLELGKTGIRRGRSMYYTQSLPLVAICLTWLIRLSDFGLKAEFLLLRERIKNGS